MRTRQPAIAASLATLLLAASGLTVPPAPAAEESGVYTEAQVELGRKLVLNIVMFGFFTAMTGLVQKESALRAVLDSVPKGTEELNTNAFAKGYDHGIALKEKSPELAGKGMKAPAKKKAVAKK